MKRAGLATIAALLFFATPVFAQDPTVVDAEKYVVEFENDHVRVVRITYGPGDKSVMHDHPASVSVMLSAGMIRMHFADGSTEDIEATDGQTMWMDAGSHLPENIGDEAFEVIQVELKMPEKMEEGCN